MYRQDFMEIAQKLKPRGKIRASIIEICSGIDASVNISETHDFRKTDDEPRYYNHTVGVMFPYGKYIIYIMKGTEGVSFKAGVINKYFPFAGDDKIEWFRGVLFVASQLALYPAMKFFFLRNTNRLKTGILKLGDIDNEEVITYLSDENII